MNMDNELSPLSVLNCPRSDMVNITKNMNKYELQFLEDAIKIRRNQNAVKPVERYGLEAEYASFNDDGTVHNYYNYIVIIWRKSDNVMRIHPKQTQLPRLFDMLANLDKNEALTRWLKREDFEEWQVEKFTREDYEAWYD